MSTIPASTSASKSRRKHTKEFTQQVVALALRPEIGPRRAAEDLDINDSLLRDWAKKSMVEGPDAFRGHGVRTELDARLAALERENRILREERGIILDSSVTLLLLCHKNRDIRGPCPMIPASRGYTPT